MWLGLAGLELSNNTSVVYVQKYLQGNVMKIQYQCHELPQPLSSSKFRLTAKNKDSKAVGGPLQKSEFLNVANTATGGCVKFSRSRVKNFILNAKFE